MRKTVFSEIQSVALAEGGCHYDCYKNWCIRGEELEQAIKNLFEKNDLFKPTADIVQCKECKHYRHHPNGMCYAWTEPCDNECGYKGEVHCVEADDFCSYGERTEDG